MPASQSLLDYISGRRKEGLSDDAIRTILLSSGHTPGDVDEALRASNAAVSANSAAVAPTVPTSPLTAPAMLATPTMSVGSAVPPPKIPFGVKFIAFFYYLGAVLAMLGGVLVVLVGIPGYSPAVGRIDGLIIFILGWEIFYIMRELLKGKNWARWFMVIASTIGAVTFLVQFLLSATAIFHLLSSFSAGISAFAVIIDIIPLIWSLFVGAYLFFSQKVRAIYNSEEAQAGMPKKLIGFLIAGLVIGAVLGGLYFINPPQVASNSGNVISQSDIQNMQSQAQQVDALVKSLNQQALVIASTSDQEDAATIKSMYQNMEIGAIYGTGGAQGAVKWQPDAQLYGYRRIFTLPSDTVASDVAVLSKGDSYYYQSNNTTDVYEAIISKSSSGSPSDILRDDIDKDRSSKYYESSLQLDGITIGPEKALEIAMLDPAFQDFKNTHTDYLLDAQLSEDINPQGYWLVTMTPDFNSTSGPIAFVHTKTGEIIPNEAIGLLQNVLNISK